MRTDQTTKFPSLHTYCVVFVLGDGERVNHWSKTPFQSFNVGDRVSPDSYSEPPAHHHPMQGKRPATAMVGKIEREVSVFDDEILDTTWIYVAPLG